MHHDSDLFLLNSLLMSWDGCHAFTCLGRGWCLLAASESYLGEWVAGHSGHWLLHWHICMNTLRVNTICVSTLSSDTLCIGTLCSGTLCIHTLGMDTLSMHTHTLIVWSCVATVDTLVEISLREPKLIGTSPLWNGCIHVRIWGELRLYDQIWGAFRLLLGLMKGKVIAIATLTLEHWHVKAFPCSQFIGAAVGWLGGQDLGKFRGVFTVTTYCWGKGALLLLHLRGDPLQRFVEVLFLFTLFVKALE